MKTSIAILLLLLCIGTWAAARLAPGPVSAAPAVQISEIRIDQPSIDNDEYFELSGAAGTSLDGLTYLVIGNRLVQCKVGEEI